MSVSEADVIAAFVGSLLSAGLLLGVAYHWGKVHLDEWLLRGRRWPRVVVHLIMVVLAPAVFAIMQDGSLNLAEEPSPRRLVIALLIGALIAFQGFCFFLLNHHEEVSQHERILKEEIAFTLDNLLRLMEGSLGVVAEKTDRIKAILDSVERSREPRDVACIRKALDPRRQNDLLLEMAHGFFDRWKSSGASLVVSLFRIEGGYLRPVWSIDHHKNRQMPAGPLGKAREKFKVHAGVTDCMTVAASERNKIMLVPDTVAADKDPGHSFRFFDADKDSSEMRFLLAIPLPSGDPPPIAEVLVVTSNQANLIEDNERNLRLLDRFKDNLSQRLRYESMVERLLAIE